MAKKKENKGSFEASLKRLEQIVDELENGEITLERALDMYEEGVELSKFCVERLSQAELKLKKLSKDIEGAFKLTDMENS
jgi:exodeoxyribonuclease VII small subunit